MYHYEAALFEQLKCIISTNIMFSYTLTLHQTTTIQQFRQMDQGDNPISMADGYHSERSYSLAWYLEVMVIPV